MKYNKGSKIGVLDIWILNFISFLLFNPKDIVVSLLSWELFWLQLHSFLFVVNSKTTMYCCTWKRHYTCPLVYRFGPLLDQYGTNINWWSKRQHLVAQNDSISNEWKTRVICWVWPLQTSVDLIVEHILIIIDKMGSTAVNFMTRNNYCSQLLTAWFGYFWQVVEVFS